MFPFLTLVVVNLVVNRNHQKHHIYMATLRKRGNRYHVVFRRMHNGKRVPVSIPVGTTSRTIAQKLRRKLEQEQQEGLIDVFGDFDFQNWLQSGKGSSSGKVVTLLAAMESFIEGKENYREKTRKGYLAIALV